MKKSIIFLSFIFISLITNAQTTVFNFKPGLNLNGLTVGSSFDFGDINIGVSYFSTLSIYENNQPGFTPYSRETKLSLILPTIGFKLNVINQEDLRGYFGIALIKPIIIGSFEENGT
ncbi:MAG: hypothetical protein OEY34_05175, partial [Cyclobacteriaceae bacterium]|nr:hypothetical protein [Cyclobacteriaceae bacterium]